MTRAHNIPLQRSGCSVCLSDCERPCPIAQEHSVTFFDRFLASTHYTNYNPWFFAINLSALIFVLIPKLPMVRTFVSARIPMANGDFGAGSSSARSLSAGGRVGHGNARYAQFPLFRKQNTSGGFRPSSDYYRHRGSVPVMPTRVLALTSIDDRGPQTRTGGRRAVTARLSQRQSTIIRKDFALLPTRSCSWGVNSISSESFSLAAHPA